jgi:purine-binding chemotaxis protein CheW
MPAQIEATSETAPAVKERADKVDFKMVTFSLAGKEYGIDIMSVKEIAKAGRFTYVPNAAPFVRGVYNLRGEIISVIDLRIFFHLPAERKAEDSLESLLILKIEEHVFGVIVDGIDKVVGISSSAIQPPHPIFGDINVKYIKGIVENGGKLYIILDVERIFAPQREEEEKKEEPAVRGAEAKLVAKAEEKAGWNGSGADVASSFVRETLAAFKGFHVTALNEAWFERRFAEWKRERAGKDVQLHEAGEAEDYLSSFWSACTGRLWEEDYARSFMATLPELETKSINIWNPGCGKGFETWSLACALRRRYPETRVKIWANDSDLLSISMAPNMVFPQNIPEFYSEYMVSGRNGLSFMQAIKDSIFFEFHDALNPNPLPPLDFIMCRDMLSLLPPIEQRRMLDDFSDKLKPSGILYLGENEAPGSGWSNAGSEAVSAYRKES